MEGNERLLEAADLAISAQRDREVDRIRRELEMDGDEECRDCCEPIDVARRIALPSARRCVECQAKHERKARS